MTTLHPPTCVECGAPLRPRGRSADEAPGTLAHYGRGLCRTDGLRHRYAGTLIDFPPLNRTAADVLDDFGIWRDRLPHEPLRVIAEHMGMSPRALEQVRTRARRRGLVVR